MSTDRQPLVMGSLCVMLAPESFHSVGYANVDEFRKYDYPALAIPLNDGWHVYGSDAVESLITTFNEAKKQNELIRSSKLN